MKYSKQITYNDYDRRAKCQYGVTIVRGENQIREQFEIAPLLLLPFLEFCQNYPLTVQKSTEPFYYYFFNVDSSFCTDYYFKLSVKFKLKIVSSRRVTKSRYAHTHTHKHPNGIQCIMPNNAAVVGPSTIIYDGWRASF